MLNKFNISLAQPNRCLWEVSENPNIEAQKLEKEKPTTAEMLENLKREISYEMKLQTPSDETSEEKDVALTKVEKDLDASFEQKQATENLNRLGELSPEELKDTILNLDGNQIYALRRKLGTKKLAQIIKKAGLENIKVNLSEIIVKNPEIQELAANLPENMLPSIMRIESNERQFAVANAGSLGCMQLTRWIYRDTGNPINPFKPEEAMKRAAEYLTTLYKKYKNENEIIRAYNQGEKNRGNKKAANYLKRYLAAKKQFETNNQA